MTGSAPRRWKQVAGNPMAMETGGPEPGGVVVFTRAYHLKRELCCGSGCCHCPNKPKHVEGNTQVRQ